MTCFQLSHWTFHFTIFESTHGFVHLRTKKKKMVDWLKKYVVIAGFVQKSRLMCFVQQLSGFVLCETTEIFFSCYLVTNLISKIAVSQKKAFWDAMSILQSPDFSVFHKESFQHSYPPAIQLIPLRSFYQTLGHKTAGLLTDRSDMGGVWGNYYNWPLTVWTQVSTIWLQKSCINALRSKS